MISWLALVIAVLALAMIVIHASLADTANGGIAHEPTGLGTWVATNLLHQTPATPAAPVTVSP